MEKEVANILPRQKPFIGCTSLKLMPIKVYNIVFVALV